MGRILAVGSANQRGYQPRQLFQGFQRRAWLGNHFTHRFCFRLAQPAGDLTIGSVGKTTDVEGSCLSMPRKRRHPQLPPIKGMERVVDLYKIGNVSLM